ncbi:MAG TPA: Fe-S cluster assembly protein SufD [Candidatus Acidoferrales bacterium]|nr:Fe-S cluster assembly protein SufD [Candidatus Acidoferrales bacterium]
MLSVVAPSAGLAARLAGFDPNVLDAGRRLAALDRFFSARSGREKPGRFWRVDLEAQVPAAASVDPSAGSVSIEGAAGRAVVCDLASAAREHAGLLSRVFGATAAGTTKFGALATAFAGTGAFVYLPPDCACDDPIVVRYAIPGGASVFPYTLVLAERGARATIVERLEAGAESFACGVTEIVTEESAGVTCASLQTAAPDATVLQTRAARPGRDARVSWAVAELGAGLAVTDVSVEIERPGAQAALTALFFPNGTQHVDVASTMRHDVGESASETIVKSAAVDRGQARYLGNIRIAHHAQGSDASLRDDALLLSSRAHIDSVPALEIAANDVKAYHGATVGALDADQIFYMESRGIGRTQAERMIALGFFEPAVERFPTEALREELRRALQSKLP